MNQHDDHKTEQQEHCNETLLEKLNEKISELAEHMQRLHVADYLQLLNRPRRLIWLNFIGGISKGFGIAVGFTIFTGTVLYLLEVLGSLGLPIIGDYITTIVNYVQKELALRK
ncbi:DUF5665 domain-containing protein [Paenibacillus sp. KN14-4R]|uniref:DUF5665 domain-containing protein n=1 Tax=Paenibacillus sp. KN14-4R TaxID=3445773 RepID=UPI003FA04A1B